MRGREHEFFADLPSPRAFVGKTAGEERKRLQSRLTNRRTPGNAFFHNDYFVLALAAVTIYTNIKIVGDNYLRSLRPILKGAWPDVDSQDLFTLFLDNFIYIWALRILWSRFKLFAGIESEGLAGPKGIYWGDQWVRASRLGVGVRRERVWSTYRWSAFAKLEKRSDHLTLRGARRHRRDHPKSRLRRSGPDRRILRLCRGPPSPCLRRAQAGALQAPSAVGLRRRAFKIAPVSHGRLDPQRSRISPASSYATLRQMHLQSTRKRRNISKNMKVQRCLLKLMLFIRRRIMITQC